jgi:hypothetical protein
MYKIKLKSKEIWLALLKVRTSTPFCQAQLRWRFAVPVDASFCVIKEISRYKFHYFAAHFNLVQKISSFLSYNGLLLMAASIYSAQCAVHFISLWHWALFKTHTRQKHRVAYKTTTCTVCVMMQRGWQLYIMLCVWDGRRASSSL